MAADEILVSRIFLEGGHLVDFERHMGIFEVPIVGTDPWWIVFILKIILKLGYA